MSIHIIQGDILEAETDAIVNTVNCKGIMGKGLALEVKKKYPENFKKYQDVCESGSLRPGDIFVFEIGKLFPPHYVFNFATKDHWKGKSKIEYIRIGLNNLIIDIEKLNLQSIAVPPLGCGYGGLDWEIVKPIILSAFNEISVELYLFEPSVKSRIDEGSN
jgi:O-acetyl-ADP-ribose deacetylase (regulator of RNase III)